MPSSFRPFLAALLALACTAAPPPPDPAAPATPPPPPPTAGERAFGHLEALVAFGPRPPGSEAAAGAAAYVRGELSALGLAVEELGWTDGGAPVRLLIAEIPGAVEGEAPAASGVFEPDPLEGDLLVLAAPFDSERFETFDFVGANDGASGAAVLLELARALAAEPLPFDTWLVFLEGDRHPGADEDEVASLHASRHLVDVLRERALLERVRLFVTWNQVGDRDLAVSRDLLSARTPRDAFFRAAERLGAAAHFPSDGAYDPVPGAHHAFWAAGMRRVVALVDDRFGGDLPPGVHWHTAEDDTPLCSAESLDVVVRVSEAGLRDNARRLHKIDTYTRRPVPPAPASAERAFVEGPASDPAGGTP